MESPYQRIVRHANAINAANAVDKVSAKDLGKMMESNGVAVTDRESSKLVHEIERLGWQNKDVGQIMAELIAGQLHVLGQVVIVL